MRNTGTNPQGSQVTFRNSPAWINGLSSTLTYLICAVKKSGPPAQIAVRRYSENDFNVKFYPDFEAWGMDQPTLMGLGANSFATRKDYQRCRFDAVDLHTLLKKVGARGAATLRFTDALSAFEQKNVAVYPDLIVSDEPSRNLKFLGAVSK